MFEKVVFEFDKDTETIRDSNGMTFVFYGAKPFEEQLDLIKKTSSAVTLQLIKQGLTADEVIKLKNQELI